MKVIDMFSRRPDLSAAGSERRAIVARIRALSVEMLRDADRAYKDGDRKWGDAFEEASDRVKDLADDVEKMK